MRQKRKSLVKSISLLKPLKKSSLRKQGSHDIHWIPAFAGMTYSKWHFFRGFILLVLIFLLVGCRKAAIYHNLTEEDANEIMVVLYEAGIAVQKEKEIIQNEISWVVTVDDKNLPEARRILLERNLPKKRELGLPGVYKDKGMIPTPDEQKARFLLAVKGEIVNSLESIPEVIDADVVINVPTPEEFGGGEEKRTTASVTLKIKPEENITSQITESKVQQFVANSVENLNPRDVSVIISYISPASGGGKPIDRLILPGTHKWPEVVSPAAETVSVVGIKVSKETAGRLKIYLLTFFILLIIISALLVIMVVRTTRMKQELAALSGGAGRPLLEGEVAEPPQLESGEGGDEPHEGF